MNNILKKAMTKNGELRAYVLNGKELVEDARKIHQTTPVATAALGRTLIASGIMGAMLKNENDYITITIKGSGPLKGVVATSDFNANVKGYVFNPDVILPLNKDNKLDVAKSIGVGFLNIAKDTGLKKPYSGQVPLLSGEIAEDIAYYYKTSEQISSAVGLGVLIDTDMSVKQAGGFIIQLMPGASEETISVLEDNLTKIKSVTTFFEEGNNLDDLLDLLLNNFEYKVIEEIKPKYKCNCTKDKVKKALIAVGKKDLKEILEEDNQAELKCHFCNKKYLFDEKDLKNIITDL